MSNTYPQDACCTEYRRIQEPQEDQRCFPTYRPRKLRRRRSSYRRNRESSQRNANRKRLSFYRYYHSDIFANRND